MDDKLLELMFPDLVELLGQPEIVAIISNDRKRAILDALDFTFTEIDENHIRMTMLMFVLDMDKSDPNDIKIKATIDMNKLMNP